MRKYFALFLVLGISSCAAFPCNDTNEDWPGIPNCKKSVFTYRMSPEQKCIQENGKVVLKDGEFFRCDK